MAREGRVRSTPGCRILASFRFEEASVMLLSILTRDKVSGCVMPLPEHATVLVVDDEPQVLQLVRLILGRAGIRVLPARSAAAALRASREHPVDLVMVDLTLPDSRATVERLAAQRPGLKMILLSAVSPHGLADRFGTDSVRFLQKPFTPQALTRAVEELLGAR